MLIRKFGEDERHICMSQMVLQCLIRFKVFRITETQTKEGCVLFKCPVPEILVYPVELFLLRRAQFVVIEFVLQRLVDSCAVGRHRGHRGNNIVLICERSEIQMLLTVVFFSVSPVVRRSECVYEYLIFTEQILVETELANHVGC